VYESVEGDHTPQHWQQEAQQPEARYEQPAA
jgi:hypothetical protein